VAAAGIRGQLVRSQQDDEQTSGFRIEPNCNSSSEVQPLTASPSRQTKGFVSGQSFKSDSQTSREQGSQSTGQFSFTMNTGTIGETGAGTIGLLVASTTAHASALATRRCSFNVSW
jgi:hypothetical protein